MKIQDLLLKFQGVKQVSENQYMAICPAHDDHSPSLSIGLSKDRKQILLNCFAGCKAEDILNNVGLKLKDMYDNDERNETNTMSKTVYTYYNADGSIAYTKNRFDKADGKKSFSFVRPNGEKGLGDKKPVPYNLPEVIRAQKVYFVEGEKCADAVIQAGRVATTLNCGSGSKWLSEYQDYFMGKEVVILPDNDKPGMKYAKKIVENIPNAKIVCLPGLPPKGDVYDWLKAGHSMEEVDDLPYLDILEQDESTELKSEPQKRKSGKNKTQENTLLEILQEQGATLFINSENNEPYIALRQNKHLKVMKIESGEFDLEGIRQRPDDEAIRELSGLKGVGVWTAEMILLFCMQRPDVFSYDDLAIQRGLRMVYHHRKIDRKLFEKYRRRFSPYCSVASLYLWAAAGGAVPGLKDYAPAQRPKRKG